MLFGEKSSFALDLLELLDFGLFVAAPGGDCDARRGLFVAAPGGEFCCGCRRCT